MIKTLRLAVLAAAFICLTFSSCKEPAAEVEAPEYVLDMEQVPLLDSKADIRPLKPEAQKWLSTWPEYQNFKELISQYERISMSEALQNSQELESMARLMKDSIRLEELDVPSIRMRLNVLHNESLRLWDMSQITSITAEEVAAENENLINAYSALNLKINDLMKLQKLNASLDELYTFPSYDLDSLFEEQKTSKPQIKATDGDQLKDSLKTDQIKDSVQVDTVNQL